MNNIIRLLNNKMFKEALETAEKDIFLAAYKYTGHKQASAARLLGVSRGTFISRMKGWGALSEEAVTVQ